MSAEGGSVVPVVLSRLAVPLPRAPQNSPHLEGTTTYWPVHPVQLTGTPKPHSEGFPPSQLALLPSSHAMYAPAYLKAIPAQPQSQFHTPSLLLMMTGEQEE